MDVNSDPLRKAMDNAKAYHVGDRIEGRLSNGLDKLGEGEVDCVIIAGMGGKLVERILEDAEGKLTSYNRLVLSPHKDIPTVRRKIESLGLVIVNEDMVYDDGHYYTIIIAENASASDISPEERKTLEKRIADVSGTGMDELTALYDRYGCWLIWNRNKVFAEQLKRLLLKEEELRLHLYDKKVYDRVKEIDMEIELKRKVIKWLESE